MTEFGGERERVEGLSEAGRDRRDAMLDALRGEVVLVAAGRRRRRRAVGGAALVALAAGFVWMVVGVAGRGPAPVSSPPVAGGGGESPVTAAVVATAAVVEIVATDPGVLERYAAGELRKTVILSDGALIDELRAMGQACGLVKMEGRAWLTCDVGARVPRARGGEEG